MKFAPATAATSPPAAAALESAYPAPSVGPLYACRYVCFFCLLSMECADRSGTSLVYTRRAICLEGLFIFSDLLPFLAIMSNVFSYSYIYIFFMRTRHMDVHQK